MVINRLCGNRSHGMLNERGVIFDMTNKVLTRCVYLRVSTQKQGRSGLGLEAQQDAVRKFVASRGGEIIAPEYVEVESGRNNERPQLEKALNRCRVTRSNPVVAKLDRLSRNAAFLLRLQEGKVPFIAADMPDANDMTVGVMALVARQEAKAVSERTKAALAAAKVRRKAVWDEAQANGYPPPLGPLGNFREGAADIRKYQKLSSSGPGDFPVGTASERPILRPKPCPMSEKCPRTKQEQDPWLGVESVIEIFSQGPRSAV